VQKTRIVPNFEIKNSYSLWLYLNAYTRMWSSTVMSHHNADDVSQMRTGQAINV